MSIKNVLIEELKSELEEVSKLEVGSEQHKAAVDSATKLADRIIEIEKFETENERTIESREIETDLRLKQLKDEKRDRRIKNVIAIGVPTTSLLATSLAFIASMNFEKNGHIFSTEGGRSALRALLKFKA